MSEKDKLNQSHGLNQEQMANLRLEQMEGKVKTAKANKNQEYEIDAHEKHLIHAQLEIKTFNQATGAKESQPFIQKFTKQEFDAADKAGHFRGYSVDILHDPTQEAKVTTTADTEKQRVKDLENQRILDAAKKNASATTTGEKEEEITHKSLVKLGKPALQAQYEQLYGEAPEDSVKVAELADLILEKLEFLAEEGAGTGEGDVNPNDTF